MKPQTYFASVLSSVLVLVASAWGIAWWLEPLCGDLTRIGGFAERDFGVNAPQLEFHPLVSTYGDWDRPVDVLVIGDSFANRPVRQWQNWLAVQTGWRIHTLDKNKVSLDALLASAQYRQQPPRVVIWNVVERDLLYEYGKNGGDCQPYVPLAEGEPLIRHPSWQAPVPPVPIARPTGWSGLNPGFPSIWLWKSVLRALGLEASKTLRVPLARSDLFSSRAATELLVYRDDLLKQSWKAADLQRIRCGFARLASRFEANGVTRFVSALAPDKSSAYQAWLADKSALPQSRLPELLEHFPIPDARLDRALTAAITAGTRDVYLPNDTHWGTAGQQAVAESVLDLLLHR